MANYRVVIDQNAPHLVELRDPSLTGKYGPLYNFYAVSYNTGGASIAPSGWHVPTRTEFETLITFLDGTSFAGSSTIAGGYLKEDGTAHWVIDNADNSSGFTALPAGIRGSDDGLFTGIGMDTTFWGITCGLSMSISGTNCNTNNYGGQALDRGFSLRLLKNDSTDPGTMTDYDENIYPTVKIGTQVWMKENLRVLHYNDGTSITQSLGTASEWTGLTSEALTVYNNNWENSSGNYLVYLLPATPVINDQSFQIYEDQSIGTTVGHVISTDPNNITYSITAGNTGNAFIINAATGYLTTNTVLDFETLSGYSLTIEVVNNSFPNLSDTAIVTVEVLKLYHICTDNGLHFNGYSEDLIGLLTVGVVHATTGTLTDYVIEWHLNSISGSTVFITGNSGNTDPSIQSFHPVDSELVQAGELYPVIRYVNINGVLYSSYSNLGYLYSPDLLTCLPAITVASMTCSNGTTGGTYGHSVAYVNSIQPSQLANRSLTYQLNMDSSSTEIAYQFYGYTIADRISIYYCLTGGSQTLIDDWVVGLDCTGTTYNGTPKLYKNDNLKTTLTLTGFTYASGDYILFNVYPSYNAPGNTDTNWTLSIKCFTTSHRLSSAWADLTCQQIDTGATMTFTYDAVNCKYVLTYNTASGYHPEGLNSDIFKYLNTNLYYYDPNWQSTGNTVNLSAYTGASMGYINYITTEGSYYPLNGQLNLTASGTTTVHWIKYTFTDQSDYYVYKNSYTGMTTQSHWTDYTTDVNDVRHYKTLQSINKFSLTSGDTFTTQAIFLCRDAIFNFDDVGKVITIDTALLVVPYTGVTCDKSANDIINYSYAINQVYSGWTWQNSFDTIWGTINPFDYYYYYQDDRTVTIDYGYAYINIPSGTVGSGFNLSQPGWYDNGGGWYYFFKDYTRVTITNPADPLNNYQVHTYLDPVTGLPESWRLLKQVP